MKASHKLPCTRPGDSLLDTVPGVRRGQMAITIVISSLRFLMIMVPVIDRLVQTEAKWSVREKKTTTAFHLAEAGIDRAKWKFAETTDIWTFTSTGAISGYDFDRLYADVSGGVYGVRISSDPVDADRRIVEAVGRDASSSEVRRIKAVFENSNSVDFSARAENQATDTGGQEKVEWGPIYAGATINATARTFPRFFSAGHVTDQDGGSTTPGTDNVYWWSYYAIPPKPLVKFSIYLASATASDVAGPAPNGCGNGNSSTYYRVGNATFKSCHDTSNKTYYITGDVNFDSGGTGNFIRGTMIVLGKVDITGNGGADGAYAARLPPEAWKEYGADWAHYLTFDPVASGAPATYAAAVAANYLATNKTYNLTNVIMHGFLYTGGSQGLNGGGNCNMNGTVLAGVNATMSTSGYKLFYDDAVAAAVQLTGVNIIQRSWYEVKGDWPSGL